MQRRFLLAILCCLVPLSLQAQTVVITEIMYNPDSSESTTETQYIEIANVTNAPINVNNWTIDDEDGDGPNTLPNVTIPARGIAVIVGSNASDFNTAWAASIDPGATIISLDDLGQTMFNLANSPSGTSEIIQLRDDMASLVDEVNYDDSGVWPSDPGGPSIYLNISEAMLQASGDTDNDDGNNWAQASNGVDGAINSTPTGVWDAIDTGSPGNFDGGGFVPVELLSFSVD
ncbi:MAG: lamin tail domain-containing protein [Acidobacteriota bacterium]